MLSLVLLCIFGLEKMNAQGVMEAAPGAFPYQAMVSISKWMCGGILISKNYVITSADCVPEPSATVYLGYHGKPYYTPGEATTRTYHASKIFHHEDFTKIANDQYYNNIALVKLVEPAEFSNRIRPAKIISEEDAHLLKNGIANISGWYWETHPPLQVQTVQILNQDICSDFFGSSFKRSQQICVKAFSPLPKFKHGSILVMDDKVIGLWSYQPNCIIASSSCKRTAVFINIFSFLRWISEQANLCINDLTEKRHISDYYAVLKEMKGINNEIMYSRKLVQEEISILRNETKYLNESINRILEIVDRNPLIQERMLT